MGGTVPAVCMPSRGVLMTGHVHDSLVGPADHPETPSARIQPSRDAAQGRLHTFGTGTWYNGERLYARSFSTGQGSLTAPEPRTLHQRCPALTGLPSWIIHFKQL